MGTETCLCRVFAPHGPGSAYIGQVEHCPIHSQELCICEPSQGIYCHEALSIQEQIRDVEHQLATVNVAKEWVRLNETLHNHYKNSLVTGEA